MTGTKKKKAIAIDTSSGSMAFNRFEMQISQVLHMAIELYDTRDFLFVLDHYDDITLFDDASNPQVVSYYQMKTSDEHILFSTALKDDWITKLYIQQEKSDWLVKELGLITNCPVHISISKVEAKDKKSVTVILDKEKTPFVSFREEIISKIKGDIAEKSNISIDDVDLSKMVHIKTTLSIERHRDIVEKELTDFLNDKYSSISVDSVKTIFSTLIALLTKKQSVENLDENAVFDKVRAKKGISRSDLDKVISRSMLISIPDINAIVPHFAEDELLNMFNAYTQISGDRMKKDIVLENLILSLDEEMQQLKIEKDETVAFYVRRISESVRNKDRYLSAIRDEMYIRVLGTCVFINKMRVRQ